MKRVSLILTSALFLCFSVCAQAQDSAPVMYIPGMPYPQQPSDSGTPAPTSESGGAVQDTGKISKVSRAGDRDRALAEAAAQSAEAAELARQRANERAAYKGVTPPERLVPENAATFQHTADNQVTWIGFMPENGRHRIFLQTTNPTAYNQLSTSSDRIELILQGTSLAVSNNQRELDMSYFKTPFRSAKATKSGRDVRVVIQLKEPVPYEVKTHDNLLEVYVTP